MAIEIEDINGSFKRFIRTADKTLRAEIATGVRSAAESMRDRMAALATREFSDPPESPAPHVADHIEVRASGMSASVGVFDPDLAEIALYNEYTPNQQPFMRPAAEQTESEFVRNVTKALLRAEARLGGVV